MIEMPQPNPTFLESLASRYNFADSHDWQPLIRHFELGQGFAFIVLLVPNDDWAEVCREALEAFLHARGEHVIQIPIASPSDLHNLAGTLLETQAESGAGAIWVARAVPEALPDYQVWFQAWRHGVNWLNQYRNPLRRQFQIPLIFVGAPWLEEVLRDNAPDLWSVQTLVARIKPEVADSVLAMRLPSPDHAGLSRGPDPDLALQEANRFHGKPGAELAVARLLYRAGMGFAARSQWHEAAEAFSEALEIRQRAAAPPEDVADASLQLGIAFTWLSQYNSATAALLRARSTHERAANLLGSARSILALGDVALRNSDPKTASARYEEALVRFRGLGDVLGEANCIAGLADSAVRTHDDSGAARVLYEQARQLFRRINRTREEGTCILGLGDIALRRADLQTAFARYQEALPLFRKIKDVSGQANAIARLGEIGLNRHDLQTARIRFEEAQVLFRGIGDLRAEAYCLAGLGGIALAQSDRVSAWEYYQAAIKLSEQVSDDEAIGRAYRLLAHISDGAERELYVAAARAAFERIGRQDLIASLDAEFPRLTSPTPPATAPK